MITIIGSINMDLIGIVDRFPEPGETVPGTDFIAAPGGKGANQALAAARGGGQVRFVGAVGGDATAGDPLALLDAAGVDLSAVETVKGPTGTAVILVEASGENMIAVIPGANGHFLPQSASSLDFGRGDVLLLQMEVPVETMVAGAKRAKAAGAAVILNIAPFKAEATALLPHVDLLVVNESEGAALADTLETEAGAPEALAKALQATTGKTVVMTLGEDGALAVQDGEVTTVDAFSVDVVDTVGAGDTFCGTLATILDSGGALDAAALKRASAAGALACTKKGAQPSIPDAADVDRLMGSQS